MDVTVAICTWNRAKLLDRTLAEMAALRVPAGLTWELLVVDNNCTDHTPAVVEKHAGRLPVRRVVETKQGHSNARNRAVDEARGRLVVWTDDDVLVDPGWLAEYAAAADRHPAAGFFGGRIDPWFEAPPPRWLTAGRAAFDGLLVSRDLGPTERPLGPTDYPFGANMAFRTPLLRQFRFDPNLGKVGHRQTLSEEVTLMDRLRAAGHGGVWLPAAKVRHLVPASRMTLSFLCQYFAGWGRTTVRLGQPYTAVGVPELFGVPRWLYRKLIEDGLRAAREWAAGGAGWGVTLSHAATTVGVIAELRGRAAGRA